jgi:hypothetical protein
MKPVRCETGPWQGRCSSTDVAPKIAQCVDLIPEKEWALYDAVLRGADERKIPFALGGAFAVAVYTGCWRDTKDLDLYVPPDQRDRMIQLLSDLGMTDYYETAPYDRWWIYRSTRDEIIVDIIWAMANHRQRIDGLWMSGPWVEFRGHRVKVLPAEALLWDKLYIVQRERCDWPDIMNLLYAAGAAIDWERLLGRIGDDAPLLAGILSVFRWLAPERARQLPHWLWGRVGLEAGRAASPDAGDYNPRRARLLDRRPWFVPERVQLEPAA